ncbi:succinyldiaminopimelate transaminase [Friedmanniella endophytica]|uniref:Aminotransferase n=1 Tax=Microlunatus kandeliicorticis TaxID=1759536 RepID=A0A7W3P624_9ACTN|nr:succinyldiaminopimelate transaminase [Microlunatus kandeliicorticis]MBA8794503.1 succinyldiaminopimelate transaminase [Microlunatus kandeliicorticis]
MSRRLAAELPDFPWDTLAAAKATASAHAGGLVDLSVGTPVDPTPELGTAALAAAADSPGYPTTAGTAVLRRAIADYLQSRWGAAVEPAATLPVIGTKELVAWLPTLLGLGPGDVVVLPTMAYPTYKVGAVTAGCSVVEADDLADLPTDGSVRLVWINSPSNPTGEVLAPPVLAERLAWAREHGAVVASDECYGEFGWEVEPTSMLADAVCGGDHTGLLALHSLSKRSNLAGYRAGFVAGEPALVADLLAVRKHLGMIVPGPVQAAMAALLGDRAHVEQQRERYARRRALLRPALERCGFRIEHSEGSLYLWATRDEDGRATVDFLARLGILAAPGDFYGAAASRFVRIALTATDERIAAAFARLNESGAAAR